MRILKKWGWFSIPILLIAALVFLWVLRPTLLSSYLTSRLGIQVFLGSVELGKHKTLIENFRVANPYGYRSSSALQAGQVKIDYRLHNLFSRPAEIDEIVIQDVVLNVEFDKRASGQNNWTELLNKMPKSSRHKEVLIHRLVLQNLTLKIRGLGPIADQTQHIDQIELDEINSQEGFPTQQLIQQIFGGAGIQQYLENLVNPPNLIKKIFRPFGE